MANKDEAGKMNGGRCSCGRGTGADELSVPVLWSCSLAVPMAYQVAAFNLLVPPDCRLPGGWKIGASRLAILPLPVGADLKNVIHHCHNELLEEDRNDPNFASDSDICPALLAVERLVALKAFEGPVCLALHNRVGCHAWWNNQSFWEVTAALRAGLPVPAPRDFTAPRASCESTRAASTTSSRLATSHCHSSAGMSFCAPAVKSSRRKH
jgi:hypothetical protein